MPFPLMALLTAAASDVQSRSDEYSALKDSARNTPAAIMRARAQQLGADPYGMMAADGNNALRDISSRADASRNNNIGALLQAYLKQKKPTEAAGLGDADAGLAEGWEDDPWGAGGF